MNGTFHELVIGGVLISPFVTYAVLALGSLLALRPFLAKTGFEKAFVAPPVAVLSLYIVILALLIVLL